MSFGLVFNIDSNNSVSVQIWLGYKGDFHKNNSKNERINKIHYLVRYLLSVGILSISKILLNFKPIKILCSLLNTLGLKLIMSSIYLSEPTGPIGSAARLIFFDFSCV